MYIVLPKITTECTIQSDVLKSTIIKNPKNFSSNPKEVKKRKTQEQNQRKQSKVIDWQT